MNTKRSVIVALAACVCFVAHEAMAFYNPSTGRWLNRDPVGERGGPNLHGFVKNLPVISIDPDGREPGYFIIGPPMVPIKQKPIPSDYDKKCCTPELGKKNLDKLNDRFRKAVDYLASQQVKPDPEATNPNELSCHDSAEIILTL